MVNPTFEVLIATVLWGFTGIWIRWMDMEPSMAVFFRLAVPTIVLGAYFLWNKTAIFTKHPKAMIFVSSVNAIRVYLFYLGLTFTSVSNAWVIGYTWPLFAVLYSAYFLGETISKKAMISLFVAFFGVVLVFSGHELSFSNSDVIGMSLVLLEALLYPFTVVTLKKYEKSFSRWEMVFYFNVIGALIFLPSMFLFPIPSAKQVGFGLTMGVSTGILAFALFYGALKRMSASKASGLTFFEVVTALIFSVVFLNEVITWQLLVGAVLIMSSVYTIHKEPQPID